MSVVTGLGLFSGGLDSILACRLLMEQGIRVRALKFVTPFFDHHLLRRQDRYREQIRELYGIEVRLVDLSRGYIDLLRHPPHGFGKHFNPCIDCKILMLTRAREMMAELGASFLFTGEVLGQRPMSQRRDTLRVIERDSGCTDLLLRPLCARRLEPIRVERQGLVDRSRLLDFTGRGRRQQMELAARFGISEYPNPAGGCVLTDPNLGARIERFYQGMFVGDPAGFTVNDINLLLVGRQFRLPGGQWLVLGRNQGENERIRKLARAGDILLGMVDRPGPTGLLRFGGDLGELSAAGDPVLADSGGLVVRYGKKIGTERPAARVRFVQDGIEQDRELSPLADQRFQDWRI